MGVQYEKFSTQVDAAKLVRLREIAAKEGRQLRAVLDDALESYLNRRGSGLRKEFKDGYADFVQRYPETIKKLAE